MKNFENHMLSKASPKAVVRKLQKSTKLTGLACFLALEPAASHRVNVFTCKSQVNCKLQITCMSPHRSEHNIVFVVMLTILK